MQPWKKDWIKIFLSAIPWAFEFLGQDIDQVSSRIKVWKIYFYFEKVIHFSKV